MENLIHQSGKHENEICEDEEANLHENFTKCKKNPGHHNFIPIKKFKSHENPSINLEATLFDLICAVSNLVVRISCKVTSRNRPKFWPNTRIPYILTSVNRIKPRLGSGRVCGVVRSTDYLSKFSTCRCNDCRQSHRPRLVWWEVYVETAAHVVFDESEAMHSSIRLFYDSDDSPVVKLTGNVEVYYAEIKRDKCVLKVITHRERLGSQLEKMLKILNDVWTKADEKYFESRDKDRINFIVSHPHGCSKQVSIGQWVEKVQIGRDEHLCKFTYNTSTCPGSSGAYVHCLGYSRWYSWWTNQIVHSGFLDSDLNFSGAGLVY